MHPPLELDLVVVEAVGLTDNCQHLHPTSAAKTPCRFELCR
jgi:hypothetical protein